MNGQVFKIHADFYYVDTENGTIEAKIRDILKKQKIDIVVGDCVELEQVDEISKQAFISCVLPRENFIPRPKAANVDQLVIVTSIKEPDLDFLQLNRYLCLSEYYKIKPILCFSKNDLSEDSRLIKKIRSIYEPLGYETVFISALKKRGLSEIENKFANKVSVLCGMSGVGKSTILNVINPDLQLRTKSVSSKTSKGTHTTRHCEIISIELFDGSICKVVDTPGFSNLKFDFLLPNELDNLFVELKKYKKLCKFQNCLHENEKDCAVLANFDEISKSRYDSYLQFLQEAKEYKELVTKQGTKTETRTKIINKNAVAKINAKKREDTRKKIKQNIRKHLPNDYE